MKKINIYKIFDNLILELINNINPYSENSKLNLQNDLQEFQLKIQTLKYFSEKINYSWEFIKKKFKNINEIKGFQFLKSISRLSDSILNGKTIELYTGNEKDNDIDCFSSDGGLYIQVVTFQKQISSKGNSTFKANEKERKSLLKELSWKKDSFDIPLELPFIIEDFESKIENCILKKVENNLLKENKANLLYIISEWNFTNEFENKFKFIDYFKGFINNFIENKIEKFNKSNFKNIEIALKFAESQIILNFNIKYILKNYILKNKKNNFKNKDYRKNFNDLNRMHLLKYEDIGMPINIFTKKILEILKNLNKIKTKWNHYIEMDDEDNLKKVCRNFYQLMKKYSDFFYLDDKNCFLPIISNLHSTMINSNENELPHYYKFHIYDPYYYYSFAKKIYYCFYKKIGAKKNKIIFSCSFDKMWNFNLLNLEKRIKFFFESIILYLWDIDFNKPTIKKISNEFNETFLLIKNKNISNFFDLFNDLFDFFKTSKTNKDIKL